jgi:hypothetical protein
MKEKGKKKKKKRQPAKETVKVQDRKSTNLMSPHYIPQRIYLMNLHRELLSDEPEQFRAVAV